VELFNVQLSGAAPEPALDRPVAFHGVNKSGSLAMSRVLHAAYIHASREDEFISTYQNRPRDYDEFMGLLANARRHALYISHYIYGAMELPKDSVLIGQLRHPLPRMLSVYGWQRRNYIRRNKTEEGYISFERWLDSLGGKQHTQMSQFAIGFPPDRNKRLKKMPVVEVFERAKENFARDVHWCGFADYFEESIFVFAHICGLTEVTKWEKDTRNKWRSPLSSLDDAMKKRIEEEFRYEIEFYQWALAAFKAKISRMNFGPELDRYKQACQLEYGERVS
jgi:hypothetical protein